MFSHIGVMGMGEGRYSATNRNNSEFVKVGYNFIPVSHNFVKRHLDMS